MQNSRVFPAVGDGSPCSRPSADTTPLSLDSVMAAAGKFFCPQSVGRPVKAVASSNQPEEMANVETARRMFGW